MIPYFELHEIPLGGGRSIAAFGLLVWLGVVAGIAFGRAWARSLRIPESELTAAIACALIPGFLLSHAVVVWLSGPEATSRGLIVWLEFWKGMSSFGGFAGAFLGLATYFGLRRRPWLPIADVMVGGLVVGWVFGRLGCTLVHDHIGRLSDFALAVRFPDGARHDLGLYEFLYSAIVLLPAVLWLARKSRPPGTTVYRVALLYAPARFLGDFLRNTDLPGHDARFGGLTFAQYACIALVAVGLALAYRVRQRSRAA